MMDDQPLLHESRLSSTPTLAPTSQGCSRLPRTIAHRGFKGRQPENTLWAIERAIQAGTEALEIDLHLSRDGVVVLSHDATLQRCFGMNKKVIDCDWEELKNLHTLMAPYQPMPRLVDVLEFLRQPGYEHIEVLLDIKLDNDPEMIMRKIAEAIESVPTPTGPDWHQRIVLGCWSGRFLSLRAKYLPQYPVTLICVHLGYARQFLQVPGISFNVNQMVLMGPLGRGFLEEVRAARRQIFVWTVNPDNLMRWCIQQGVDGVITDHPDRFRQVCDEWEKSHRDGTGSLLDPNLVRLTLAQYLRILAVAMYVLLFGWFVKRKYLSSVERVQFEKRKMA